MLIRDTGVPQKQGPLGLPTGEHWCGLEVVRASMGFLAGHESPLSIPPAGPEDKQEDQERSSAGA